MIMMRVLNSLSPFSSFGHAIIATTIIFITIGAEAWWEPVWSKSGLVRFARSWCDIFIYHYIITLLLMFSCKYLFFDGSTNPIPTWLPIHSPPQHSSSRQQKTYLPRIGYFPYLVESRRKGKKKYRVQLHFLRLEKKWWWTRKTNDH